MDYLLCWCGHGTGYPFYGIYNRERMKEEKLSFIFDNDLIYYNEGTFLHRIFLSGRVKFVPNVHITFSVDSAKRDSRKLAEDFKKYFARTLLMYGQSKLNQEEKEKIYATVIDNYSRHLLSLDPTSFRSGTRLRKAYREIKALVLKTIA